MDRRIILKYNLKKMGVSVGLNWLRILTSAGLHTILGLS
jgi:hypothetical protein